MKLALVVPGPLDRRSGGYSYDFDLVEHLRALGHGVEVWSLPRGVGASRVELARRLTGPQPDVVIFDALTHPPVTGLLERLKPRSKTTWMALVHHLAWLDDPHTNLTTSAKKTLERRFLATMDAYLSNSDDTRRTVAELRGSDAGFRPSLVCRPPTAVPSTKTTVTPQGRLLFLGNLVPRKNLHGLLKALSLLAKRRPELGWSLTVAGSPDFVPGYAARCKRLAAPLGGRVVWAGPVSDEQRERLWAQSDLLALPSFHEGWGMAHAESLARGIPSLAIPRGGALELLGDAALWSEENPMALSAALEKYLGDHAFRENLVLKAHHRGEFLKHATGFAGLANFLTDLSDRKEPATLAPFDFGAYLESKASVDTRSLHPRVLQAAFSGPPPTLILELGGGTGTMARRLRDAGLITADTRYELVDQGAAGLEKARRTTSEFFSVGRFTTREADLLQLWKSPPATAPDLLIAHALLDLFEPRAAAPALARLGAKRYWLTHLFDGLTSWDPVIDPVLDRTIVDAYHRSMEERAPGGAQGSPRSARDWLEELPKAGFRILDAASSDWIVRAENGVYPADEARFLRSILHFFRTSLTGRAEVDQAGLSWWLRVREGQIVRGEAVFLAHQLDIAAELTK